MTKIPLTALAILLSAQSIAFADCNDSARSKFAGFYAGAHTGVSFGWGRFSTVFDPGNGGPGYPATASGFARQTDALIGVLAGYRQVIKNDFTAGLEVVLNYTNNTKLKKNFGYGSPQPDYFDANLQKRLTVIPSLMLGKTIAPRLQAFLGLGMSISNFRQKSYNYSADVALQKTTTRVGFAPSLGLEYSINPKLSLTGNVNWELYSKIKQLSGPQIAPSLPLSSYSTSIRPKYSAARIGLIYKF